MREKERESVGREKESERASPSRVDSIDFPIPRHSRYLLSRQIGLGDCFQSPLRADVYKSLLIGQLSCTLVLESIREHHLQVCLYFSRSVLHDLLDLLGGLER